MNAPERQAIAEGAYHAIVRYADFIDTLQYQANVIVPANMWVDLRDYANVVYGETLDVANGMFERLGGKS